MFTLRIHRSCGETVTKPKDTPKWMCKIPKTNRKMKQNGMFLKNKEKNSKPFKCM